VGVLSDYKEKSTVGFSDGQFLWDEDGNHYLVVASNSVLGLTDVSDKQLTRYKVNVTKSDRAYITKQKERVYLTEMPTPNEVDLLQEESLWNS
jgi:hypothetical protein